VFKSRQQEVTESLEGPENESYKNGDKNNTDANFEFSKVIPVHEATLIYISLLNIKVKVGIN
jgi:hypothetical protein